MTTISSHLRHSHTHRLTAKTLCKRFAKPSVWKIRIPHGHPSANDAHTGFIIPKDSIIQTFHELATLETVLRLKIPAGEKIVIPSGVKCEQIS